MADRYLTSQKYHFKWKRIAAEHYVSPYDHVFDIGRKNPRTTLMYIVRGKVALHTVGDTVYGHGEDFFYIPHGVRYHSVWQGEGGTEHYCIHAVPQDKDQPYTEPYALQRLPSLSNEDTGRCISDIYDLLAKNDQGAAMAGLAKFFDLYARILPLLHQAQDTGYSALLTKATDYIRGHYAESLDVSRIAEAMQVSESTVYHLFKNELGTTPIKYYNRIRLEKAALAMGDDAPIEEIAYRHGFPSYGYFRELFKSYTGMTPKEYRKQKYEKT